MAWNYLPPFWVCIQLSTVYSHIMLHSKGSFREGENLGASGGKQLEWISCLQSHVLASSSALIWVFISTHQMWTNVPIPEVAQSIRLATTVLETTLVSATQDIYPEVERRISRDQGRHVKVGAWVFWGIKSNLFGKTAVLDKELEVEVDLSWVQYLVYRTEANLSIHAFIQQTLLEHLLYTKHYSTDGGYFNNTKNIYSTRTSYHGERIRQQTKCNHVFGLSLLLMAWHSSKQWQLCWLNWGYRIHFERGSLTRGRWCWLLAGSSARVVSWWSKIFSMRAVFLHG